jgi:hypothetical protein
MESKIHAGVRERPNATAAAQPGTCASPLRYLTTERPLNKVG